MNQFPAFFSASKLRCKPQDLLRAVVVPLILALTLSSCGLFPKTIKVGSKNIQSQMILSEIAAQHLENKGIKVVRRIGMGNAAIVHQATLSGDLDIYPDDTGTAIAAMLKENPIQDTDAEWERVRAEYDRLYGLRLMKPVGAGNAAVAIVSEVLAAKEGIANLSAAVDSKVQWRIGITEEFSGRTDGLQAFSSRYRLIQKEAPRVAEASALYTSLQDGQLDMVIGAESDGMLGSKNWRILPDDKKVFAPGQLCFLARRDTLGAAPGLEEALNQLSGKISTTALREMGRQIEVEKRPLADVAAAFLKTSGIK
jgi:osmoprotectant transport system substrate-binding protein